MVNLEVIAKYKKENIFLTAKTNSEEVRIRSAKLEDIPWLHQSSSIDPGVLRNTVEYFSKSTRAIMFILESEYGRFGEMSLTNICDRGTGEYIWVRRMSKNIAKGGMTVSLKEISRFAFEEIGLENLTLNVFADNQKALDFYSKTGFIAKKTSLAPEYDAVTKNKNSKEKTRRYLITMELTKERLISQ